MGEMKTFVVALTLASLAGAALAIPPGMLAKLAADHELAGDTGCDLCAAAKRQAAASRGTILNPPGGGGGFSVTPADNPALIGNTDVLNYALTLTVTPSPSSVIGTNVITIKSLANNLTTMDLELHQNFTVTSVLVDGAAATFTRPNADKVMRINFPTPKSNNQVFTISVAYNGTPVSGGFGSYFAGTQNGQPLVCTLSETRFAHTWWPVKENNNDKATGDMHYIVPDTLSVAANGLLISETAVPGAKKDFYWKTNYATSPYLFAFSTTNYTRFNDTWTYTPPTGPAVTMPMNFFIYPTDDNATNRNGWLRTKDMLTAFSDKFGTYPFAAEKYGLYEFAFGGGMEHQTMTGQGSGGTGISEQFLTAHELGHQWWGDMITCAAWNDIWLNEGFATYSEGIWREFRPSSIGVNGLPGLQGLMAARRPTAVNDSVYCFNITSENRIFSSNFSYRKGAWALHMLRHIMGDTNFFQALANYRAAHLYGTATTADFQAQCEAVYGSSLNFFFQPWVYGIGAPTYNYAFRNTSIAGQNYAEIYLEQFQLATWPMFDMPLDLDLTDASGTTRRVIRNNSRRQHFLIPVTQPVTAAALDPDIWVLTVSSSTDTSITNSKVLVPFSEGPAKVTDVTPAINSSSPIGTVPNVTIQFHKAMNATTVTAPGAITLVGASGGTIPVSVAYNATAQTATVAPTLSPLPADQYTVTVRDTITDSASAQALDGEIAAASLPSGNGVPAGNASFAFTITPCSLADLGRQGGVAPGDGILDNNDFVVFINYFFAADLRADLGQQGGIAPGDGLLDNNDFVVFIDRFFAGGC